MELESTRQKLQNSMNTSKNLRNIEKNCQKIEGIKKETDIHLKFGSHAISRHSLNPVGVSTYCEQYGKTMKKKNQQRQQP